MSRHRLTKSDKAKLLRGGALVLAAVLFAVAILGLINYAENNSGEEKPAPKEQKHDIETFLVLGLDTFGEGAAEGTKQADFVLLFVIDNTSQSYNAIQISRDTMVEMNVLDITGTKVIDKVTQQIALAHSYGNGKERSCRNVADAVSNLLGGITVDHYLSVTMDAVSIYNDYLGGVEVEVLEDFTGIDDSLVKGETVTLMGDSALTYVRARKGVADSGNENRMSRQHQYLNALYEKTRVVAAENEDFEVEAVTKVINHTVSDCSVNKLQRILEKVSEYEMKEIIILEGENRNGEQYMEFYPDQEFLQKTVDELFYLN